METTSVEMASFNHISHFNFNIEIKFGNTLFARPKNVYIEEILHMFYLFSIQRFNRLRMRTMSSTTQ